MIMKKSFLAVGAIAVTSLLASGCSLLPGGDDISKDCQKQIEVSSNELISSLEDAFDGTSSFTQPDTDGFEAACKNDDKDKVASEFIMQLDKAANASSASDQSKKGMAFAITAFCKAVEGEVTLTDKATETCAKAKSEGENFLNELGSIGGAGSGSTSDDIFDDGFAIDDVDTDLDFPSSSSPNGVSGLVAPYTLTYVIDGKGTAYISYLDKDDKRQEETVTLPWQYEGTSEWDYNDLSVDGIEEGQLSCAIYHNGTEVSKDTDTDIFPFVNCYAFR
jgi:hypothetical protein